ncbi:hypothetical protein Cgig2_008169 [Carnegiea gigantea]|uniref:Uncharacterized protein n=1 Tax=Carnegiea gigantea TaxID=171969 RepID=A0A9Q1QV09_9CARY|nr:hypothetical protein Cgig2_008169 [Carnegiea gigantea]
MGNAAFCAPAIIGNGATEVVRWDGKLESYAKPVKAAELMFENPGQFVCDAITLQVGHRIVGLVADDELERGQLYFLLPMEMIYSVLTHEEVSHLNYKAYKALKPGSLGKIFPVCMFAWDQTKRLESDSQKHDSEAETSTRVSSQRSWRPALETIIEKFADPENFEP